MKNIKSKVAIIGDIHSCVWQLHSLLNQLGFYKTKDKGWINTNNYFLISLGDLNDYRYHLHQDKASAVETILTLIELQTKGWSITINSNHHNKLINYYKKTNSNVNLSSTKVSPGLRLTINELNNTSESLRDFILEWLSSCPYFYCFDLDKSYVCTHAFYADWMLKESNLNKVKRLCLYGPRESNTLSSNPNDYWWNNLIKYPPQSKTIICGHYHKEVYLDHAILIDGGAGEGGDLLAYLPHSRTTIRVPF